MAKVTEKLAAGFVIFRRAAAGNNEYLLLQTSYGKNHWTPPKGHVDPGEDVFTTAQRETLEESGLKPDQYKVHEQFKEILRYPVKGKPKAVHYWLAELIDKDTAVTLSDEHVQYRWCNLEEAKLLSAKDDMNSCLDKADKFILNI